MKRTILNVLKCVSVLLLLSLIVGIGSKIFGIKRYLMFTESQYIKDTSVFINELDDNINTKPVYLKVVRFNSTWYIYGKKYIEQKSSFNISYDPTVNWRVDLSQLNYSGYYKDIKFYSSTGKCDNDILVAVENGEYYLLDCNETLSPYLYSINDFVDVNNTGESLKQIWCDHLSGEHNIRYVLVEDNSAFKNVCLRLKNNPELIYTFSSVEYKGHYFSKLPFDKTSNDYYSITKRINDASKATLDNQTN